MSKTLKQPSIWLFTIVMLFSIVPTCMANSAEPPSITIIVADAPEDLELTLSIGEQTLETRADDKVLETQYSFYYVGMHTSGEYKITMTLDGQKSMLILDKPPMHYNNIYTLDWEAGTLTEGKAPLRTAKLVGIRILATLLIEAFIFLLFGFREYSSWTMFLLINLITQGVLNIWLSFQNLFGYIIISLILGELFVYLAELISFTHLVKEKGKAHTIIYVLLANTLSLVAGGYLIGWLSL